MSERLAPAKTHGIFIAPGTSKAHARRVLDAHRNYVRNLGLAVEYGLVVARDKATNQWGVYLERHDDGPIPAAKRREIAALLDGKMVEAAPR